jgi:hypothetical protein
MAGHDDFVTLRVLVWGYERKQCFEVLLIEIDIYPVYVGLSGV